MRALNAGRAGPPRSAERKIQAARAVRLWAGMTLSLVVVMATLAIWHLVRRGRRIQGVLGPSGPNSRLNFPQADGQVSP